jgi:hypothetical protein
MTHLLKPVVDTLIVWTESNGTDMALSFQEAEGCGAIWCAICPAQGAQIWKYTEGLQGIRQRSPTVPEYARGTRYPLILPYTSLIILDTIVG